VCIGVITDLAGVLALDLRGGPDVVDVAMSEEQEFDAVSSRLQPLRGILGSIEEDIGARAEKAVRVKDAASEGIDLHQSMVTKAKRDLTSESIRGGPDQ
jgi:hypothetical protein